MIVADGVFSMSGDIFNFPEAVKLAEKYNCRLYIDDAHALGVLGPKGQGTEHHFNMAGEADVVMGTFSKSFASIGGFVAGSRRSHSLHQAQGSPVHVLGRDAAGRGRDRARVLEDRRGRASAS